MHTPTDGFPILTPDLVVVEDRLHVSFGMVSKVGKNIAVQIGWTWSDGGSRTVAASKSR